MARKYVVVDAHNHYVPREAAAKAGVAEGIDYGGRARTPNLAYQRIFDLDATIRQMEDCGIDVCLVGLSTWIAPGMAVCRVINDSYQKLDRDYPGKFITLAHVPYQEGAAALDELDRAVKGLGLKGVTVLTSLKGVTLDSESLYPFYERVSKLDVPLVVHPTVKEPLWGGVRYAMSSSVSREYEIAKSVVEVLQGVLPRFPDLKFLFAHYGGGIPALKGRIISWFSLTADDIPAENRVVPRTLKEVEDFGLMKTFNRYFDKMYFDMAGFGGFIPIARAALLAVKHTRLCFGTDYPFEFRRPEDYRAYVSAIKRLDMTEEDKRAVLGGNVLRLFRVAATGKTG
ncbi:MAG: amidohydrolase [Chloroflexi bacterium]|nr:amidohydrolase [Chloroflexota bacterium]